MLRKNPGFTAVAVLTLALGIGANSAIFSVVNSVVLQPLPYRAPGELLFLSGLFRQTGESGGRMSYTKFTAIREQSGTLQGIAAFYQVTMALSTGREPEAVNSARVSREFFPLLGVAPARGRDFLPEEEKTGAADVALISDGFWHSHFAASASAVGKSLTLDGRPVTVIGVLPASFRFPLQYPEPDVWLPRVSDPAFLTATQVQTGAGYLILLARLRSGETIARAQAEMNTINDRYRSQFGSYVDAAKFDISTVALREGLVGPLRPGLIALLAAVGFVLLIACANIANLLLVRATSREREMALRKALGASPGRLARQLLSESVLLALLGGALGVALAAAAMPTLRAFSPGTVPRLAETQLDASVLLFSLLLSVVTGILFGCAPAVRAAKRELYETLKDGTRGSSEGGQRARLRSLLVVAEIAVALVLMTGAGLLIESFSKLMSVNPGFSSANLMTFPINLPPNRYAEAQSQVQFYRQLLDRVRALPGVQSAGVTSYLPLGGGIRFVYFCPEGTACQGMGRDPLVAQRQVSDGYFAAVRTPLLQGRVIDSRDTSAAQPVVVVNQTLAERYWPGQNPIGKHLANSRDRIQREVIGVVGDVKFNALNAANSEEMYLPLEQAPWASTSLVVRSASDPQALVSAVRAKISEIDSNLPIDGIASMDTILNTSVAQPRVLMQFVGIFAGFALLLAAIGIYGVMAYAVSTRRQEIGVRMSLGAQPSDVLGLVVAQGMRLAALGVAIGVLASWALTRFLASLLFNVRSTDPVAFGLAAAGLLATAALACYLPARRATRIDPIVVLRHE